MKRLSLPYTYAQVACLTRCRFYLLMKKVTDVIHEMGPIFSDSEEDFSILKGKQSIIGEERSIYSVHDSELTDLHQSSGIFQSSVSSSLHTSSTLLGTNRERALLRDKNKRAYAESHIDIKIEN